MSPEAGWYADPTDPTAVRWWDGSSWSAQTRPAPRELAMAGASVGSASVGAASGGLPESALAPVVTVTASPSPAPTPAPDPAPTVAPDPAPAPAAATSDEAVDRSRPGARPPLPPAPAPAPDAGGDHAEDVDRSRPGARRSAPPTVAVAVAVAAPVTAAAPAAPRSPVMPAAPAAAPRPVVVPSAPASAWVDGSAAPSAPAASGHGFGGAPAMFGAAPAGHGAVPPGFGSAGVGPMHPGTYTRARSWKRPAAIAVVAVVVLGGAAAVGVPKYRDAKAQATAAQAPDVLVHSAPRALAGQKKYTVPGIADLGKRLVADGATWAWAQAYGTRDSATLYLASDVPREARPDVVRALTSRDAATSMLTQLSTGFTAAGKGQAVAGTPAEYASPVGGKTWCMPMTVSGVAGGYCLWTNGKEWMQVLSLPGLEQVAAKSTMTSLTSMAAAVTQSGPTSTLVPKPSAK